MLDQYQEILTWREYPEKFSEIYQCNIINYFITEDKNYKKFKLLKSTIESVMILENIGN